MKNLRVNRRKEIIQISAEINPKETKETTAKINKCIEMNENENTTSKNLWDTVKAVLRGRFITIQAYVNKQ